MGAVSNVTTLANTWSVNRILSDRAAPEFAKSVVMAPLIYAEDLPEGQSTATKSFRREGSMTGTASLAEANPTSLPSVRVDTSVDAVAAKAVRLDGISIENQKFGLPGISSYVQSQARAIGRAVDDQGLGLFTSVTSQVDALGALTVDHLDEAQLKILSSAVPEPNTVLKYIGPVRAFRNIKSDVRASGGAAFGNERFLSIFNGPPSENGYVGSLPGFDLYHVPSGLADVGGQKASCLFHPGYAFASMFDRQIEVWQNQKGSEGVYTEILSFFFWSIVLWNDAAACEVLSQS